MKNLLPIFFSFFCGFIHNNVDDYYSEYKHGNANQNQRGEIHGGGDHNRHADQHAEMRHRLFDFVVGSHKFP
jgi:hypothetical protein